MDKNNLIIQYFKRLIPTFSPDIDDLSFFSCFDKEEFGKKETVFRNGDVNTKHYIIESGLMRMFIIDKNGREFNVLFAKEKQIIGDLVTPAPTSFFLEAIEPTIAYSIRDEEFKKLMQKLNISEEVNFSSVLRRSYVKVQKRLVSMMSNSAEENYLEFKDSNPELIQRLPQYHIAAYLGISAEFLSKIIAKTVKK